MKYVDGLNYLDQLKNYVETSLSCRQNNQQTIDNAQKVDQSVNDLGDQSPNCRSPSRVVRFVGRGITLEYEFCQLETVKGFCVTAAYSAHMKECALSHS